ncbi:MAG: amidophosphoribosyltransferase [Gammaproteobacteria bacterium]|nr:amidophosphoribosyltransferase [Gammaproteobacteria bacterium]
MCGLVGILGKDPVNQALYDGLTVIQHRGQDAAGIMTSDGNRVYLRKDNGLVNDVFRTRHMVQLRGGMGVGHVRYPTAGSDSRAEAQPFYVNSPFGIALGHNGNLTNAEELRKELFVQDLRQLNTSSDSEILLNIFAHELRAALGESSLRASPQDLFTAASGVFRRCKGAYAVIVMVVGVGLMAFRDPCGIRPLVYGTKKEASGLSHIFASESVALDVLSYRLVGDIQPGEAVFVDLDSKVHRAVCAERTDNFPCIFEYVYLARPDSIIDEIPVYQTRIHMGQRLGQKLKNDWPEHDIDVVIPVPDTSRTAALEMAKVLKLPYREGFVKNRYIGRTFIMPGQAKRKKSVRQKLNAISSEFNGKNVLLVDDSIVRGTTSQKIIELAREAGASKVYFASAAPPVRYPNVYGIDMPSSTELIGNNRSTEEICREIGADKLIYQELGDLINAVRQCNREITEFDTSCFDGRYVTGDITPDYLRLVDHTRNDQAKLGPDNDLDISEVTEIQEKRA